MAIAEIPGKAHYVDRFPGIAPILTNWLTARGSFKRENVSGRVFDGLDAAIRESQIYPIQAGASFNDIQIAADAVMDVLDIVELTPETVHPALRQAAQFAIEGQPEAAHDSLTAADIGQIDETAVLATAHLVSALNQGYGTETQGPSAHIQFDQGLDYLGRAVVARVKKHGWRRLHKHRLI